MFKLIDGRDSSFEIVGAEKILDYLGYPKDMNMQDASEALEAENFGMNFYHIVEED